METTVVIPETILSAVDQLASELDVSRDELYTMALDAFIKSRRHSEITDKLNEIYATESSELDPIISQMQIASIPGETW